MPQTQDVRRATDTVIHKQSTDDIVSGGTTSHEEAGSTELPNLGCAIEYRRVKPSTYSSQVSSESDEDTLRYLWNSSRKHLILIQANNNVAYQPVHSRSLSQCLYNLLLRKYTYFLTCFPVCNILDVSVVVCVLRGSKPLKHFYTTRDRYVIINSYLISYYYTRRFLQ